jgi:hypothetical protein
MRGLRVISLTVLALGATAAAVAAPSAQRHAQTLPRIRGGPIYPVLAGDVRYGDPSSRLYQAWGRPPLGFWQRRSDIVNPSWYLRSNRAWPKELSGIMFSTKNKAAAIARSRLRRWRTPEGIHIGSSLAQVRAAYGDRLVCGRTGDHRYCGSLTPAFRFFSNGYSRRQIFRQSFHMTLSRPTVNSIAVVLEEDEGRCDLWVAVTSFNDKNGVNLTAECWGPLTGASVSFAGATVDPESPGAGVVERLFDDSARPVEPTGGAKVDFGVEPMGATWTLRCDDTFSPPTCAPGRGAGDPAWPAGSLEEWRLSGLMVTNPAPRGTGGVVPVPAFRFTAQFQGLPSYSVVVNRTTST